MFKCKFCYNLRKNSNSLRNHERLCKDNPDKQKTFFQTNPGKVAEKRKEKGYENQYTKAKKLGIPAPIISEETRKKISIKTTQNNLNRDNLIKEKISDSMKKAHAEGRAWNIGKSRWNNEPSYPEKFFMQVIQNEFNDKNYIREYPFGIYSIDFAWPDKKIAIEIDGEQHLRFESYKERDLRKDELLKNNGWLVLRIRWKDMYNDTKRWIKIAKDFVK
jgi:very-short-patch-repair endonuclease